MDKIKNIKLEYIHIAVIILGIIFISLSIFHSNLWFDESYSVALASHSFAEIWKIGGNDVHPILYYMCLHILNLIFGNNVVVYRIFSCIPIAFLGILGFTHIRKDFGKRVGFLFSIFSYFLPFCSMYSGEIRMYSLGLLLGTIMAIYAYRIYKNNINKTTFMFFGISSLAVSYTHYYGLMFAGIVNLLLLIFLIKNIKTRKQDLIKFVVTAIIQVICYLPWLICFLTQLKNVSKGFWITLSFPQTFYEILTVQFDGNFINMPIVLTTAIYAYLVFLIFKTKKEERKPGTWAIGIYVSIIIIVLFISICMKSVILLNRYLIIVTGLIIFAISYFIAKDTNKYRIISVCIICILLSCFSNFSLIKENYNTKNKECINFIEEKIQKDDIILYSNAINGAVITALNSFNNENISYFYNKEHWGVEEAYKAYAPYMEIKNSLEEILENYKGRIWLIESENTNTLFNEIAEKYTVTKIEEREFYQPYKNYSYTIELIEKF